MSSNKHRKRRKLNVKRVLSFLIPIILVLACATVFFTFFIKSSRNKPEEPGNPVEYVSIKESSETQSDIPVPDIGEGTEVNGTDGSGPGPNEPGAENGSEEPEEVQAALPDEVIDEIVENLIHEMSLHEKICQMTVLTPDELTKDTACIGANSQTEEKLKTTPVGGICIMGNNVSEADQIRNMISDYQNYAKENHGIGLFVCTDEEGGAVVRFGKKVGNTKFSPMYSYKDEGEQTAYDNAKTIGSEISAFGVNLDLAPVADVWTNPENQIIGTRAYSNDPKQAAKLVASAVKGFHDGGVMCTLKHFPGHGDTKEDSHLGAAYSYKTLDELREAEFLPFAAGIDAGADMVMVSHVTVPAIEDVPSSLSPQVISILRDELGFQGVIITDSLAMQAVEGKYSFEDIGVRAVTAGNDLLLTQHGSDELIAGVENAVLSGVIPEERINESLRRILKLKVRYGLVEQTTDESR